MRKKASFTFSEFCDLVGIPLPWFEQQGIKDWPEFIAALRQHRVQRVRNIGRHTEARWCAVFKRRRWR